MPDQLETTAVDVSGVLRSSYPGPDADASRWRRAGAIALGGALVVTGLRRRSLGGTVMALAGGLLTYRTLSGGLSGGGGTEPVSRSITIGASPDELTALARDPETLERITGPIGDVTETSDGTYRWSASGPLARELSWEMELTDDSEERLRWETVDEESGGVISGDAALFDGWTMSFDSAPGDRGTEVTLEVRFDPPGGTAGSAALERLEVVPESLVTVALDRFKSLAETGEIPTTAENPSARGRGDLL